MSNSASTGPHMSIGPQQHYKLCKPAKDENKAQAQKDKYNFQKWRKSSHDRWYLNLIYTHCQTSDSFCLVFSNQWCLKPANSGRIATILQLATCRNIRTARWQKGQTEKGQFLDVHGCFFSAVVVLFCFHGFSCLFVWAFLYKDIG